MRSIPFFYALLLGVVPATASESELVTDRPDQTESSVVVPFGRIQLELGWTTTGDDEDGVDVETSTLPATLIRVGLAERVELRIGWAGQITEEVGTAGMETEVDGAGDTELGTKIYLRGERGRAPEMALIVGTSLPTGDDVLTTDRADPAVRLCLAHTLTERISLGYNVGVAWATERDGGGERDTLSSTFYTLATGFGITDRLGAFAEVYGEMSGSASGPPAHAFDGGFTYLVRDNLQLDLAGGVGLSHAADDWFVGLGLSARFPH